MDPLKAFVRFALVCAMAGFVVTVCSGAWALALFDAGLIGFTAYVERNL